MFRHYRGLSICGNKPARATLIIFKAMERTLQMIIFYITQAELYAAMRTFVNGLGKSAFGVAPDYKILSESFYPDNLVFSDLR